MSAMTWKEAKGLVTEIAVRIDGKTTKATRAAITSCAAWDKGRCLTPKEHVMEALDSALDSTEELPRPFELERWIVRKRRAINSAHRT